MSNYGQGQTSLVFIHGWGVNSAVWQPLVTELAKTSHIITIDLPGFASNAAVELPEYTVAAIADLIAEQLSQPAIIIGWSLGGLVATELALRHSHKVKGLVTVASSPCFLAKNPMETDVTKTVRWPGLTDMVLASFHQQLSVNAEKTIKGFLKLQAMGSPHVRQDIKLISELVMQYPVPKADVLDRSLMLLTTSDYRQQLIDIKQPFLRLYGRLDGLVPKAVIELVNELSPSSQSYIFEQASHAPFISHQAEFITLLRAWLKQFESAY